MLSRSSTLLSQSLFKRTLATSAPGKFTVSFIEGDGIGPEIATSVKKIFSAADVPVEWEACDVGPIIVNNNTAIPEAAIKSINKNKVALKGPLATPVGKGHRSLNLTLRKTFDLYANLRPAASLKGLKTTYSDIDFVVVRENTEGEYFGVEHDLGDKVEAIKLITQNSSEKVIKFAIDHAKFLGRPKVLVVHKATVQPLTDGLFYQVGKSLEKYQSNVKVEFELLDDYIHNSVKDPKKYHDYVVVAPNLYGDIITDLNSGLSTGSLGMTPSANIGEKVSIFEAVHGSAPDIAGKDLANPSALLFAAVMMLEHLGLNSHADKIKAAALKTIAEGIKTGDLGGKATNSIYTDAIIKNLSA
ncbi:NAD-dependent isocitrate dehydrogenase [Hanseniaspora osmophila]|uniref:Isocitrate dehydrogenase [NAD] subunit 2, mitochondrial n=1 Tax=Hanseniaspora osmophila TaxID=56408 RepID=A0A1E5RBS0_9ASCO|nr:Isocitrate dehydrogenase [NAD] subunit 2, mitochondrial [Hanseniaspora osmophila]